MQNLFQPMTNNEVLFEEARKELAAITTNVWHDYTLAMAGDEYASNRILGMYATNPHYIGYEPYDPANVGYWELREENGNIIFKWVDCSNHVEFDVARLPSGSRWFNRLQQLCRWQQRQAEAA